MTLKKTTLCLMLSATIFAVSGCNSGRERLELQHPPAADLQIERWSEETPPGVCTNEPPAPDAEDPNLTVGQIRAWENEVLLRGRACRDALGRTCRWHINAANEAGQEVDLVCTKPQSE